jgi:hypothetical protein|tara:strand:- start:618 stop:875 length:258 start_codon:yes stop_codon:yes gene_type:complete
VENKVNIFGKSFIFDAGSVVRWSEFSERKDFYGILIEMKENDVGGRGVLYGKVLSFGESRPKAVLAIKLRHISDKKLVIEKQKAF